MNILVSACLLGEACRYDGGSKPCAEVRALADAGHKLVPVCPEVDGGLSIPRDPCEIVRNSGYGKGSWNDGRSQLQVQGDAATRSLTHAASDVKGFVGSGLRRNGDLRVVSCAGVDCTAAYAAGACHAVDVARREGCRLAILKSKSPACGSGQIYDGSFSGTLRDGWGVAAAALRDVGVHVVDEKHVANGVRAAADGRADVQ